MSWAVVLLNASTRGLAAVLPTASLMVVLEWLLLHISGVALPMESVYGYAALRHLSVSCCTYATTRAAAWSGDQFGDQGYSE